MTTGRGKTTTEFGDIWYGYNLNCALLYVANGICFMRASQSLLTCNDNYMIEPGAGWGRRFARYHLIRYSQQSSAALCVCAHAWPLVRALYAIDTTCVLTAKACFCPSIRASVACALHCSNTATHLRCCSGRLTTYSTYRPTVQRWLRVCSYIWTALSKLVLHWQTKKALEWRRRRNNELHYWQNKLFVLQHFFQCVAYVS